MGSHLNMLIRSSLGSSLKVTKYTLTMPKKYPVNLLYSKKQAYNFWDSYSIT